MKKCKYDVSDQGYCGENVVEGKEYCKKHLGKKCWKCDKQAVGDCHKYYGSYVCGSPMCPDHKHEEHNS